MGAKYTTQAIANYNATPPADDGSEVAANQVSWAKHKTKLADPIKTLAEAINTALVAYVDEGPVAKTGAYTTEAGDHNKIIEASGTFQITLLAPGTAGAGYRITVINVGSGVITVAPASGNIDGVASRLLAAGMSMTAFVNADEDEYLTESRGGEFAIGTKMVFYQASAPTGWTGVTLTDGYMLRGISVGGTGGSTGGTDSPVSWDSAHTHAVSGNTEAGGAHTHTLTAGNDIRGGLESSLENLTDDPGTHTHAVSITSGSGGGTFAPRYADVIVCTKTS